MYRNIRSYDLKYTDVDAYDNIKLSSLLSFMEESACLSAAELGFGYDDLAPKNLGFIIVNVYIKLERNIHLNEKLTIHTWPLKPSFAIFLRDSELYVGNEKVGVATARWCMIDTASFTVQPATAFFKPEDFDNYNTERSVKFSGWKIPVQENSVKIYSRRAAFSDYDHYFHVNNTKYADFCMDVFSVEELKDKTLSSVQISYVKQCKENEIIDFYRSETPDGFTVVEGRVGEELRVQTRLKFD